MKDKIIKIIKDSSTVREINQKIQQENLPKITKKDYDDIFGIPVCTNGKDRKFLDIKRGYGYCGRANVCECARKISSTATLGKTQSIETKNKRKETIIEKYGVTNVGQTEKAIQNRKKFYDNSENIKAMVEKTLSTKRKKYGDKCLDIEKFKENQQKKYGSWYTQTEDYKQKRIENKIKTEPKKEILYNIELLSELAKNKTPNEIATELGYTTAGVVLQKLREYGIEYKTGRVYSIQENELYEFIKENYDGQIIKNNRTALDGKEIDIYLPGLKLGFEFNGNYWHSDRVKEKSFHRNKYLKATEKGIHLVQIYECFWNTKKEILKKKIKTFLGNVSKKIYARNCEIRKIETKSEREFLNDYHLQGYVASTYCYGLYFDNKLISLMSFVNRKLGKSGKNNLELLRYATSCNVVGGASKLFSYFIKQHKEVNYIKTYSDNDLYTGNMYLKLGFTKINNGTESYFYVKPNSNENFHRLKFTKKNLIKLGFDKNKTEKEIMDDMHYLRIYTSGNTLWGWIRDVSNNDGKT